MTCCIFVRFLKIFTVVLVAYQFWSNLLTFSAMKNGWKSLNVKWKAELAVYYMIFEERALVLYSTFLYIFKTVRSFALWTNNILNPSKIVGKIQNTLLRLFLRKFFLFSSCRRAMEVLFWREPLLLTFACGRSRLVTLRPLLPCVLWFADIIWSIGTHNITLINRPSSLNGLNKREFSSIQQNCFKF